MARYSLANYKVALTLPSDFAAEVGLTGNEALTIGGEGSYLDSVTVEMDNDTYNTKSDSTGSWVHDVNLSKTGKVTITINQMSDKIAKFKKITNLYSLSNVDYEGVTIAIDDNKANHIVNCSDCYFQKIPNQEFNQEAGTQAWVLTCGKIEFN